MSDHQAKKIDNKLIISYNLHIAEVFKIIMVLQELYKL